MADPEPIAPMHGGALLAAPAIDRDALVAYRVARVQRELARVGAVLAILVNPVSLRYVADYRDYALFQSHIPIVYAFVPVDGDVVLYGARRGADGRFVAGGPARGVSFFDAGERLADEALALAADVHRFLAERGHHGEPIAAEYLNPSLIAALDAHGFRVLDAVGPMERARAIKSPDEIACIRHSIAVAEEGIRRMRAALVPGITENALWSILHATNIAHDGDWLDGRMLCSGPRTNPWLQEAGGRAIEDGDLVAFDTDMVGPFGYCADISRTWRCGDGAPSPTQRDLYQRAAAEIVHNQSLVRPGVTARELSENAFRQPDRFVENRYPCLAHGVGMCDEWPKVHYRQDWSHHGYDAVIEPGMVLCIESYVGAEGGGEGVKLEQQVVVTEHGTETLSTTPLEEDWLG